MAGGRDSELCGRKPGQSSDSGDGEEGLREGAAFMGQCRWGINPTNQYEYKGSNLVGDREIIKKN